MLRETQKNGQRERGTAFRAVEILKPDVHSNFLQKPRKRLVVAVVEDHPEHGPKLQGMAARVLGRSRGEIILLGTEEQAVRYLLNSDKAVDLVFLDHELKDGNGARRLSGYYMMEPMRLRHNGVLVVGTSDYGDIVSHLPKPDVRLHKAECDISHVRTIFGE